MKSKKNVYPSKTTLNLVIKDRPSYYSRAVILGILVGIIVIGAFAKFAVIDRLSEASRLEREAILAREHYEQLVSDNAAFVEVRAEYEQYFKAINGGVVYADAIDVLGLIEKELMTVGGLQSATLSKDVLSVILTNINLEQTSGVVRALYAYEMVSSVSVSSAETTIEGAESSVSLSITLVTAGGGVS